MYEKQINKLVEEHGFDEGTARGIVYKYTYEEVEAILVFLKDYSRIIKIN